MDHHEKLAWAGKHLDALDKAVADFAHADNKPFRVVRNFNIQTREHEAKTVDVKPQPPEWSPMVGDIVHGLRSSLDSLVYWLAVKDAGQHAADCSTNLQFPIADRPFAWHDRKTNRGQRDRVALLSLAAQAEIERLQPFNRPDKNVPSFLTILRNLSNTDKHRRLVLVITKATEVDISLTGTGIPPGYKQRSTFRGPLKEDTVIHAWSFEPYPTPPDMEVHCDLTIDVEFGDAEPHPRQSVRASLRYLHEHIASDVFSALDPFLT